MLIGYWKKKLALPCTWVTQHFFSSNSHTAMISLRVLQCSNQCVIISLEFFALIPIYFRTEKIPSLIFSLAGWSLYHCAHATYKPMLNDHSHMTAETNQGDPHTQDCARLATQRVCAGGLLFTGLGCNNSRSPGDSLMAATPSHHTGTAIRYMGCHLGAIKMSWYIQFTLDISQFLLSPIFQKTHHSLSRSFGASFQISKFDQCLHFCPSEFSIVLLFQGSTYPIAQAWFITACQESRLQKVFFEIACNPFLRKQNFESMECTIFSYMSSPAFNCDISRVSLSTCGTSTDQSVIRMSFLHYVDSDSYKMGSLVSIG